MTKNHVEKPKRQIFASIKGEKEKRELRFYSFIKCLYSKTNYHIIIEAIRLRKMELATQKSNEKEPYCQIKQENNQRYNYHFNSNSSTFWL